MIHINNYEIKRYASLYIMKDLNVKDGTFSGNVTFNYFKEGENSGEKITINDIISDIKFLKKENEKLKEIIDILWNAPPGGGPGFQEANENWKSDLK
jgi:hypothetical protein